MYFRKLSGEVLRSSFTSKILFVNQNKLYSDSIFGKVLESLFKAESLKLVEQKGAAIFCVVNYKFLGINAFDHRLEFLLFFFDRVIGIFLSKVDAGRESFLIKKSLTFQHVVVHVARVEYL